MYIKFNMKKNTCMFVSKYQYETQKEQKNGSNLCGYLFVYFPLQDVSSLGPATDFYKKLALDCSAQQIAVDVFMFNGQYADMASIGKCLQF